MIMLNMLPESEQNFAYEMLKRIVLAWDPDFTKVTPDESKRLETGRKQLAAGEYYQADKIDWNNLEAMDLR